MGYRVLRKKNEALNDNFVHDCECLRDQHFGFLKLLQFIFIINIYYYIMYYIICCMFIL